MINTMITTVDNPFDPFLDLDGWTEWDERAGYFTNSLLARVAKTSDSLSEADQEQAYLDAITEIAEENVSGVHRLVHRSS